MNEKRVTIIVSDLHLGGGPTDPGDDHVYQDGQFTHFIEMIGDTPEGKKGDVELIINGDFLEFAQVGQEFYTLGSSTYWCSETESLKKLELILTGHADIFAALKKFRNVDNYVTIAAGNHDVDLYWPKVQKRLQEAAGPVSFQLGTDWFQRYGKRLQIGHGHMFDPANKFENWSSPILVGPQGLQRLEMCPGTLFIVKFVNWLEQDYPFSDNIKPVTALASILLKEDRSGLAMVGWMLSKFLLRYPKVSLDINPSAETFGDQLTQMIVYDDTFADQIVQMYKLVRNSDASRETVRDELKTEQAIFNFLYEMLPRVAPQEWLHVFDALNRPSLDIGVDSIRLSIIRSGVSNDKKNLSDMAESEMDKDDGPQVVVLGHSHQPDHQTTDRGVYFNPGSWTRYVDLDRERNLSLEDLKQEDSFPYQLNYVRVEYQQDKPLKAAMHCYREEAAIQ